MNIKKSGLYKYVQSLDFQIMLLAYSKDFEPVKIIDLAQGEALPIELVEALQSPSVIKHAYNASFEWYALNKFYYSPLEQWRCTMLHGLYCGLTSGLAATAAALGLPEDKRKLSIGSALIKTFCVPVKPTAKNGQRIRNLLHHDIEKWKLFKEYCKQDVAVEMEVERRLSAFPVPETEQKLWELDQRINAYGVKVDKELIDGAIYCSEMINAELMQEAAKRMLEIRQELSKTSVKKYKAMAEVVCSDGRVRGLLQFYGANRTVRWAGRLVQVQNMPKNYLETLPHARDCVKEKKVDALKIVYSNVSDTLSQLIRTAFVASDKHIFLVAELALGYQGSTGALIAMGALKTGLPDIVKRWRDSNKRIVDHWYSIESAALEVMRTGQAVGIKGMIIAREVDFNNSQDFLTIKLPSGRKLFYAKPFLQTNEMGREALYYRGINQETKNWENIATYGGKLTENIVQAIARDCLAESLKRLEAAGYQDCFHVHDEVILDVLKDMADLKVITSIMGQPIDWAPGLILKAEGYRTFFYKKE